MRHRMIELTGNIVEQNKEQFCNGSCSLFLLLMQSGRSHLLFDE